MLRWTSALLSLLIGVNALAATVSHVGGVFFNSKNPQALAEWYQKNFGFEMKHNGAAYYYLIPLDPDQVFPKGRYTTFSIHQYLGGDEIARNQVTINLQVNDIEGTVRSLRANGNHVDEIVDEGYGKFTWMKDLDGNRLEIWEPAAELKP